MLIEMRVVGVMIDPVNSTPIVILRDSENRYTLPIWIGVTEASAIMMEIEGIKAPRPNTHDLIRSILDKIDVHPTRVEITELKDNTYYAVLFLKAGAKELRIDSRPSDAIAVALKTAVSILVDKTVIDKSIESIITATGVTDTDTEDKKKKYDDLLKQLTSTDFGKYKM
ncbi:MAG: bifunctional nuclease family protein [Deltaproteobacteria bacterium]|nr:bifunctional nuclease family protein [Deltaproteobacteria bacterium]